LDVTVFFSNEGQEPPHIHIQASGGEAKFWLNPVGLASNYGFSGRELNEIGDLVTEHQTELMTGLLRFHAISASQRQLSWMTPMRLDFPPTSSV
jgi:hypothetical protein